VGFYFAKEEDDIMKKSKPTIMNSGTQLSLVNEKPILSNDERVHLASEYCKDRFGTEVTKVKIMEDGSVLVYGKEYNEVGYRKMAWEDVENIVTEKDMLSMRQKQVVGRDVSA